MIHEAAAGRWKLYAIEDGWYRQHPLQNYPDSDVAAWAQHGVVPGGLLRVSFGCFLLTDGDRLLMVDSGEGGWAADALAAADSVTGQMPAALARLGVEPGGVETVVHSHLHIDHVGGDRTAAGEAFFPEARLIVHQADVSHFRNDESWLAERARAVFFPFIDEGRVQQIDGASSVAPGISVLPTPGHTPGHLSVVIDSGDDFVVIAGDATHHPIQAAHPDWSPAGDVDRELSAATRADLFHRLAERGGLLAGGHYPRPGFGRVVTDGPAFRFVPAGRP